MNKMNIVRGSLPAQAGAAEFSRRASSYLIDTNIFLRSLIKDNTQSIQFRDCVNFLWRVKENKINAVTTNLVLAELVWTLSSFYKVSKPQITLSLHSINNSRGIVIVDTYNTEVALKTYEQNNVKFVDAMIASIDQIQSKEWAIVSYDKDFDKIGVLRLEPSEVK